MSRHLLTLVAVLLAAAAPGQAPGALKKAAEGRDLLVAGNADDALARFKDAQIDLPDAPELALDVGLALYKLGRFEEAASAFLSATTAKDVGVEALARFHLGNTLFRQGNLEGALIAYNASLRLVPDDEDAKTNREIVIRHMKERARQKKDEEKKHEIEKLLRECLKHEIEVTRATRAVQRAAGEEPKLLESVAEIAAELDAAAESRPESRPSGPEVERAGAGLASAQDQVAQLAAELVDKIRKEAESRPAAQPGGQPPAPDQDPEKLKKVAGLVTEAGAAMKDASPLLRGADFAGSQAPEEKALRKLLDALNEFLDELTRIILEQGKTVTATNAAAADAGVKLELPESATPPLLRSVGDPGSRPAKRDAPASQPVVEPAKFAPMAAKEKELRGRTDAFAGGVEQMLQQMKAAETRAADSRPGQQQGPKPKDVAEALTLLHKASGHLGTAADELGPPRVQPAFEAELLALKELAEAKKKLSPPQQQQQEQKQDQDKKDDQKKNDDQKKQDQKDKDKKKDDQKQDQDKEQEPKKDKKDEKKMSPEEAQALLDRLRQQEKDWRDKKNADRKPAKEAGVKKDW